ncbi:MAG: hypothetical protein QME79_11270 [Bacillota bacterium]|nr:hypothetical protein [Bacillota bacterium]
MNRTPPGNSARTWARRARRALLLGLVLALALGTGGLLVGLLRGQPVLRSLMWAEFAGGTAVCAVAAVLLLWRPARAGQTAEREEVADVGFGLLLSGLVAFAAGLLLSWLWRL